MVSMSGVVNTLVCVFVYLGYGRMGMGAVLAQW